MKTYTAMFGGEAGYGVMSAGAMVAKAAARNSLWSMVVNEYPSLIKGGLNTCLVRLAQEPVGAHEDELDFLGALSQQAFDSYFHRVRSGGIVLYDNAAVKVQNLEIPKGVRLIGMALLQKLPGDAAKVMANSALLGAFCALTAFSKDLLLPILEGEFKQEAVQEQNKAIFADTYAAALQFNHAAPSAFPFTMLPSVQPKMLINGNEAIALGAIQGGCRFCAGYPMTPGSSILVYLAEHGPRYGVVFKQAEDEIAVVNMLIGASYAGVRSLAATSGGGFSLMVEALGFAAQAELPIVLVNAQRGGPSTGLPTRTSQADLLFTVFASQGEFPRFVVAPGDVEECFQETVRLFELTDRFQVPGLLLTDKYLADSSVSQPLFALEGLSVGRGALVDEEWLAKRLAERQPYKRYEDTIDGVSPRAIPGQRHGCHIATSYAHGEDGFYGSGEKEYAQWEPEVTEACMDKWYRKIPLMEEAVPGVKMYGPEEADLTLLVWGSTKGAALEAMALAKAQGLRVNVLQILYVSPFPVRALAKILPKIKRSLLIEGNKTAQLGFLLRGYTGYVPTRTYLKYDARAFTPTLILSRMKEVLG